MDQEKGQVRFGDFVRQLNVSQQQISFNDLAGKPKEGEVAKPQKLEVSGKDVYRILAPYTSIRFMDQAKASTQGITFNFNLDQDSKSPLP